MHLNNRDKIMEKLIGRTFEISQLQKCYSSNRAELVIVYGRRRIGKTFLVRQFFSNKLTFSFVGGHDETTREQLARFAFAQQEQWHLPIVPQFSNWSEAFRSLQQLLQTLPANERKVIFLDEMPWMDTPKSRFITALEAFWNGWAATRDDIMLVACGSSTSWMVEKIIGNQGGLFGRVTEQIYLRPFNLKECEQLMEAKCGQWDRYQIIQAYMALGGVPFYFDMLDSNQSVAQNIDRLFFENNARLANEFDQLYSTLFKRPENHISVVKVLALHPGGLTRKQISSLTGLSGGGLTNVLNNLTRCDIVDVFNQFHSKTQAVYHIVDLYTLFYLKHVVDNNTKDRHYWSHHANSPSIYSWQGHAFEIIGLTHIDQIKLTLSIGGVATNCYAWHNKDAQIDLVIERADRMINLCEMKYSGVPFVITKDYAERLRKKAGAFKSGTKTRYGLLTTLVTTFGVEKNKYSYMAQNEILMDDLFK